MFEVATSSKIAPISQCLLVLEENYEIINCLFTSVYFEYTECSPASTILGRGSDCWSTRSTPSSHFECEDCWTSSLSTRGTFCCSTLISNIQNKDCCTSSTRGSICCSTLSTSSTTLSTKNVVLREKCCSTMNTRVRNRGRDCCTPSTTRNKLLQYSEYSEFYLWVQRGSFCFGTLP